MKKEIFIHPTSIVNEGAIVGAGTSIWHFCHIMPGAVIGNNCKLGQNVFIDNNVQIGNGVKIQNNVSIYNGVIIEDDVFVGPSAVFTNVINPRSFIERKSEFKKTFVRKGASIGANATLICGLEIGSYAFVGAGAVITKNIPAYAIAIGNPARLDGWISESGHRLNFDNNGYAKPSDDSGKYFFQNNSVIKR